MKSKGESPLASRLKRKGRVINLARVLLSVVVVVVVVVISELHGVDGTGGDTCKAAGPTEANRLA